MKIFYRAYGVAKPFLQLLHKRQFSISRWSLLVTLIRLAVLKRIRAGQNEVTVRLGNFKIAAPNYHVLSVLIKEKFVDQEYYFECIHDNPVIIDCGANIGISMLYFKSLFPNSVIYCFEPYPKAYHYLERNIAINKLQHVVVHKNAVSDKGGDFDLHIPGNDNIINARISGGGFTGGNTEKVRCVKLSDQVRLLSPVELVKLDVEGSEMDVLQELGEAAILGKKTIHQLIIEFHQSHFGSKESLDNVLGLLQGASYDVQATSLFPDVQMSDVLIKAR